MEEGAAHLVAATAQQRVFPDVVRRRGAGVCGAILLLFRAGMGDVTDASDGEAVSSGPGGLSYAGRGAFRGFPALSNPRRSADGRGSGGRIFSHESDDR